MVSRTSGNGASIGFVSADFGSSIFDDASGCCPPSSDNFSTAERARECTRECIGKALDDGVSVVLVPGGQAEIFSTRSWGTDVAVYRGHKGFVNLAMRHRARLVPVFSFGEWEIMDNVYLPALQRRTRKWFGFPVPFWPYGLCGLPLPRKPPHGITVVVDVAVLGEGELDGAERPLEKESWL